MKVETEGEKKERGRGRGREREGEGERGRERGRVPIRKYKSVMTAKDHEIASYILWGFLFNSK